MARLHRIAYRIVWVNPRAAARGFEARAGGLVAALPHCDALVSGHSLEALDGVAVDVVHGDVWRLASIDVSANVGVAVTPA